MVVVIAAHTTFNLPATLGLRGWLYLLPYFMFGIALFRFNPLRSLYQSPKLLIFLIGIVTVGFVVNGIPENYAPRNTFLFLIIGCSLICVVFSLIPKISGQISGKILGRIGQGSYTIYLFHIFFTAATRIVLKMAGLMAYDYRRINLIAALFAAVIGSLLIEKLARRSSLSSLLLLGEGNLFRLPRKKQRRAGDSGLAWHPSITNRRHS